MWLTLYSPLPRSPQGYYTRNKNYKICSFSEPLNSNKRSCMTGRQTDKYRHWYMHRQPAQKEGWSVVSATVTLNRIYHISVVRQTLSTITVVCSHYRLSYSTVGCAPNCRNLLSWSELIGTWDSTGLPIYSTVAELCGGSSSVSSVDITVVYLPAPSLQTLNQNI